MIIEKFIISHTVFDLTSFGFIFSPVQVDIENKLETRRVFNVFATMKGAIEPGNLQICSQF